MSFTELISLLKKNFGRLFMTGFLFAFILMGVFLLTTKRYEARTDFLIVQSGVNARDLYSLSKSAEYIGGVLGDAIHSDLFIDEAIKTRKFDAIQFLPDSAKRQEEWEKLVKVKRNFQSSMLTVSVKGDNSQQVLSVSHAVAQVLIEKNALFRAGSPEELSLKVLSGPKARKKPSVTEWVLLGAAGFVAGVLLLGAFILFSYEVKKAARLREQNAGGIHSA